MLKREGKSAHAGGRRAWRLHFCRFCWIMVRMKTVAVLQSNYIPWKGYFDVIHDVDEFIFYDDVQYTKNDWRNRNRIYTANGVRWLTLPCGYDLSRTIRETTFNPSIDWQAKHLNQIRECYGRAPFFSRYADLLDEVYRVRRWEYLSELNQYLIREISGLLGIKTRFSDVLDYESHGKRNERLLSLLVSAKADVYVSGPAAKDYLDEAAFLAAGVRVVWKDYAGYPAYRQMHEPFEPSVSILDLLFNTGEDAPYYIWGWRTD